MRRIAIAALAMTALAATPAAARAAVWAEPAAPLNLTESAGIPYDGYRDRPNADWPTIAVVDGKLHAGWTEWDGTNYEVRVARFDGNVWTDLGDACSPINASSERNAFYVSLADDGGRPFIAWTEVDERGIVQVEAARYDAATDDWVRPWGSVTDTPVDKWGSGEPSFNGDGLDRAFDPEVEIVDGVVYVGSQRSGYSARHALLHRLEADESKFEWVPPPEPTYETAFIEYASDGSTLFAAHTEPGPQGRLSQLVGETWQPLPQPGWSFSPKALAVRGGVPYVLALVENEPSTLLRFVGGAWEDLAIAPPGEPVGMAFVGDVLHLATIEAGRIHVHRLTASGFELIATASGSHVNQSDTFDPDDPTTIRAALVGFGGRPWVAWPGWSGENWKARVAGLLDEPVESVPPRARQPECPEPDVPKESEEPRGGGGTGVIEPADGVQVREESVTVETPRPRAPRLVLLSRRVKARRGVVRLRVRCAGETNCRGIAIARVASARGRGRTAGRARVNLAPGRTATILLRLTPRGRRLLRRGALAYELTLRPR